MSAYIQSRKIGRKRWETHIPPFSDGWGTTGRERAERRIEECRFHGTIQADREYRVVDGAARAATERRSNDDRE